MKKLTIQRLFCHLSLGVSLSLLASAADVPPKDWKAVRLWTNARVSARLHYKPSASLADIHWLALELENHTPEPIIVGQMWLDLDATRKEITSGKELGSGGLSGGTSPSIKVLSPGLNYYYPDALEYASANMGLPPSDGLRVEVQVSADLDARGFSGKLGQTPTEKPSFVFEWRFPTTEEFKGMTGELKGYLAVQSELKPHLLRMTALFPVPQVRDNLTLDDMLPALQTSDSNVRWLLVPNIFARYSNAPPVLAYYREAFQKETDKVYWDAADSRVWNEEFLEPLVRGCEQDKWHYFHVLERHPGGWRNRPQYVSRLYAALLKHHPILLRNIQQISAEELEPWAKAVEDAGEVGDRSFIHLMEPALEDRRIARIDYGSGGVSNLRVCDRALDAILKILDGDSWVAFEKAGIKGWRTDLQGLKAYERVLKLTKARLKSLPPEGALKAEP